MYEIYLRVTNGVRKAVFETLGWNTPDWRVKNACHACCYKVRTVQMFKDKEIDMLTEAPLLFFF